jgi:hypothetical protein
MAAVLLVACHPSLNEDIEVADGSQHTGDGVTMNGDVRVGRYANASDSSFRTINGQIHIEDGARVNDCATVNGGVDLGDGAETGDLKSVNGDLRLGRDAKVNGRIMLVNGAFRLSAGSRVSGDVDTVNGLIELVAAEVGGSLSNVNGGMHLADGSLVRGDLRVREAKMDPHSQPPKIVIGRDSRVEGKLIFDRPVRLYVHQSAVVGPIEGAEAVSYTGDDPG